jgi:hypothetical protein
MLQILAGSAGSLALYTVTSQPAQAELLLPDVVFNAMVRRMGDRPFTEVGKTSPCPADPCRDRAFRANHLGRAEFAHDADGLHQKPAHVHRTKPPAIRGGLLPDTIAA